MGKGRQGRLLSYLALAIIIVVGALVHGLPASAASSPLSEWRYDAAIGSADAGDHGILPGPLQPRDIRDQRSPRGSVDNGIDGDTLAAADAGAIELAGRFSFFLFDSDHCSALALRLAHRPRDPPRQS
ncbi:MAG: hypothetical protein JO055_17885 [Alphaproteobacteria bacterium]|nr:hypothetical protein [Alphaproteobacteria bacterium]